jgi:hypothetical protein
MKTSSLLTYLSAAVGLTAVSASGQVLFQDNFDGGSSASNWTVNASAGQTAANFAFDYSTVGIPSAPNSGGTTTGLRLAANWSLGGIQSGLSVSPIGGSFTGDYVLRFDMWINFNGPLTAGGNGSTQVGGGGFGTAGTTPQYTLGTRDSVQFGATGDGGIANDYRAFLGSGSTLELSASPIWKAGSANNSASYYAPLGSHEAPAAQLAQFSQQTGATQVGAAGMTWRDVEIHYVGGRALWYMDGLLIADADLTGKTLGGTNILLNYYDINTGASNEATAEFLQFAVFDNVRVEVIPEPSTYAAIFGALALVGAFVYRRRKNRV